MRSALPPDTYRLLKSKLSPPAADARQVIRSGLVESMMQAGPARLVLVRAPAGFGKTTAMAQARLRCNEAGMATAWLTADGGDNDPSRFINYLNAAIEDLLAQEAVSATQFVHQPTLGELALSLMDRVSSIPFAFTLFVDEFEIIQAPGVMALVGQLVENLPAGGRLVIGSRTVPDFRLARLRATGGLVEIDVERLRFSLEETRTFFEMRNTRGIDGGDLEILYRKTEGWIAALWLASLALERHESRSDFISGFSGTDAGLTEYLAEEVLAQQTEAARNFLLRTSILREISAPLCQALMPQSDTVGTLRQLTNANIFMTPVEGRRDTWRYHSLFASFLLGQLQRAMPHALPSLHRAAAGWFAAEGRSVPAIDHFIAAGDTGRAVEMLAQEAMPLLTEGRLRLLTRWFDALPGTALRGLPLLQIVYIWAACFTRGPHSATALMRATEIDRAAGLEIQVDVAALQVSLQALLDEWEESYAVGKRSLHLLPSPSVYADAALVNGMANSAATMGLFAEARQLLDRARQSQGRSVSAFHRMYSETIEGVIDMLEGRLRQAKARFRLAVQTTQVSSLNAAHGNAWAGLPYAACVYEGNDLAQAAKLLQVYLPLACDAWLPDHIVLGHVILSRIAFSEGEIDYGYQTLSELEYLGHERQLPRLTAAARLERARALQFQGHLGAAADELGRAGDAALWRTIGNRRHLPHDWEDHEIGQLRWQLAAGDAARTASGLAGLLTRAERDGRIRRAMKLRLLYAMALAASGDEEGSQHALLGVLKAACAEGAIRLLVDEGPAAAAIVIRAQAGNERQRADPIFTDYLQRLRTAFGPQAQDEPAMVADEMLPQLLEPLTAKEIRLLQLLAEGYSNRALTEKLFVSDSTVRTHLRNINGKLGAHNRTQAVAMARRLGVIR